MARRLVPAFLSLSLALSIASVGLAAPRQINLTPDSAPGWIPSEDLEQAARNALADYFAAQDSGRLPAAYARLSDIQTQHLSFEEYSKIARTFNDKVGALIERRITTLTWTKDPPQAPAPGVYAAFDLVGRFAKADRYCGYLILYQPPAGGGFGVMREESNFLDNATARRIEKDKFRGGVEEAWAQASARCPNYHAISEVRPASSPSDPAPLAEAHGSTIGYPNVEAALKHLRGQSDVVFSTNAGWTIATQASTQTIWSFSPPGYPAYPAAVKRWVVEEGGRVVLKMDVLCQASKTDCDDLVRSFQQLNSQASGSGQRKR